MSYPSLSLRASRELSSSSQRQFMLSYDFFPITIYNSQHHRISPLSSILPNIQKAPHFQKVCNFFHFQKCLAIFYPLVLNYSCVSKAGGISLWIQLPLRTQSRNLLTNIVCWSSKFSPGRNMSSCRERRLHR
jgi:hypothetical protein